MKQILCGIAFMSMCVAPVFANSALPGVTSFIDEMHQQHGFSKSALEKVFADVEVQDSILKAIARPAEKSKPWYEYRKIFISDKRIQGGVDFWQQHQTALARAEQEYGVPAEVIIAILGVETSYGGNVGSFRVIDALSTLAFRYPPRSSFFRKELAQFLQLTDEEEMSALTPVGSYAGAMGLGQFMPSSYRAYAVDFDHDGHRDIWTNPVDAIGSIANYLQRHGWQRGQAIVHPTQIEQAVPTALLEKGVKPSLGRDELLQYHMDISALPDDSEPVALITLTQPEGEEYWITHQNFYSITRYNHSRMYAMVVTQLAELIRQRYSGDHDH